MADEYTPQPWERQPGESAKAYEAFSMYRDMGLQRSLRQVAAQLQKSETLIGRWSGTHRWVDRVAAFDIEQDRRAQEIAQKEQAKAIRDMRKRHADVAHAMILKAAKALQRIPEDEIKAQDISRMVDVASKLERISRGDVGEVVEERDGGQATPVVQFYMPSNSREDE